MSNNKTISKRTGALAMVCMVLAASLLATLAFPPTTAVAQESERRENLDKRIDRLDDARPHSLGIHVAKGAGIATDTDTGDDYRSGFRVVTQKVNGSDNELDVKRGFLGIFVDGKRVYYAMIPETWNVVVSEDGLTFTARGQVENEEQGVFDVSLDGYFAMHTRIGNLWSISGTMEGEDKEYELHYVGISHAIRAAALNDLR
ncbi:MAG TPA: hypothetical protein VLA68_03950 [Nitrososphaera sp.]|nr:hypothetical protein [Nitrososphaera sp.]